MPEDKKVRRPLEPNLKRCKICDNRGRGKEFENMPPICLEGFTPDNKGFCNRYIPASIVEKGV